MFKNRNVAQIFENIVGKDNFSEDSAIISSYSVMQLSEAFGAPLGMKSKNAFPYLQIGGVILPRSTEEVQAIVKVCNKYKITYKAHSTGLWLFFVPTREESLIIDLSQMNRILKIDDKNMYAVIEPFVTGGQIHAELRKKGLTCHVIGAGSQASILASVTAFCGMGHTSITTSGNPRNCLGEEWVMPDGEVVTWGLVEEGKAGHPGMGYRGITRGTFGSNGSLGVYTKCAIKLYPYPGPSEPEITGEGSSLGWKVPDNFKIHVIGFPTPEKLADFNYKICEAKIAYLAWTFLTAYYAGKWSETNEEMYENLKKFEKTGAIDKMKQTIAVITSGVTENELKYKEKVLNDIMKETGAEDLLKYGIMTQFDLERFFLHAITSYKACSVFREGNGYMGGGGLQFLNMDGLVKVGYKGYNEIVGKGVQEGIVSDYGPDANWFGPEEQRPLGHIEFIARTDRWDPELCKKHGAIAAQANQYCVKEKLLGTGDHGVFVAMSERSVQKHLGNYFDYKHKIKKALDPNDVGDPLFYIGIEKDLKITL